MFNFHKWLKRLSSSTLRSNRSTPSAERHNRSRNVPRTEELERRLAPATFIWSGTNSGNWSDPGNWQGGVAPTGLTTNATLDDLVFPATGKNTSTTNDLPINSDAKGHALPLVFNSITFSGSGYTLSGEAIQLGTPSVSGSGSIFDQASSETISLNITEGGASGSNQIISTNSGGDLTLTGQLSAAAGINITKQGAGTLYLENDNSGFSGSFTISGGVVQITNPTALGAAGGQTVVTSNSQLQVNNVTGNIAENLTLNGSGTSSNGALLNVAGTNTWSGTVLLDSNVTLGASAGTLTISGEVTDAGAGHSIVKEGTGTVDLTSANVYTGTTTINNGILEIENANALGTADGTAKTEVLVTRAPSGSEQGALELNASSGSGFTVSNKLIELNGDTAAATPNGSLINLAGANIWTGNVNLGSANFGADVTINVAEDTSLEVTGLVSDPNGTRNLTKIGAGTLIFPNANSYRGYTEVADGILNIRDSKALGTTTATVYVDNGATLQLQTDNNPDSVTGTTSSLKISNPLTITGDGPDGLGAIESVSGLNSIVSNITLTGATSGIGVDPDPNPTNSSAYYTNDYSLTIVGNLVGGTSNGLDKFGTGQLILPHANLLFTGPVDVYQGWITVRDNNSLGATIPFTSENNQPTVKVENGAAIQLYPNSGNLNLGQNFELAGDGITHPFALINQMGAIENLAGVNIIHGNVILQGQVGIGVEQVFGVSQLYLTGQQSEIAPVLNVSGAAKGGPQENDNVIDTKGTSATLTVNANVLGIPDDVRIYLGDYVNDPTDAILIYDSTTNGDYTNPTNQNAAQIVVTYTSTSATINVTDVKTTGGGGGGGGHGGGGGFGGGSTTGANWNGDGVGSDGTSPITVTYPALTSTDLSIIVNQGGSRQRSTQWSYTATIKPNAIFGGGILKLGSKLLVIQGPGTYTGADEIAQGAILAENNTALGGGGPANITTVDAGAALLLANQYAQLNGGSSAGIQVWNTGLVLNGPGNTSLGATYNLTGGPVLAPLTVLADATIPDLVGANDTIVASDDEWRGPVTLNTSAEINIPTGSRLTIDGVIDDASNTVASGSDLIKIGGGDLVLAGTNTYRGITYIGTSATNDPVLPTLTGGTIGVDEFFDSSAPAALPGGTITVSNSQGLVSTQGGTIVQSGSALQVEGNITIAGESLIVQGSGEGSVPGTVPETWDSVGPAPIAGDETLGTNAAAVSGRVTGVAVDPTDPMTIYISTSGGGAWKTINGGATWQPLFDFVNNSVLFTGAIAIAPSDPNTIYLGTGEADNSNDSYYGTGVYKSSDGGQTWTLLQNATVTRTNPANPLYGLAVSQIVVDPNDSDRIFVAVSDRAEYGTTGSGAGIWRFDSNGWFNMTGVVSAVRGGSLPMGASGFPATAPKTPGPDDDFALSFPTTGDYSSVGIGITSVNAMTGVATYTLYMSLGTDSTVTGIGTPLVDPNNGVYFTSNPTSTTPIWYVGDANSSNQSVTTNSTYDTGGSAPFPTGTAGMIKLAATGTTVYAALTNPTTHAILAVYSGVYSTVYQSVVWTKQTTPSNYMGTLGYYDSAIVASGSTVYVAGDDQVLVSTNGGSSWTNITTDSSGNAPHWSAHALAIDKSGNLVIGTDGGIWRSNTTSSYAWSDLNGNLLSTSQLTSVGTYPTDTTSNYAGVQGNGIAEFPNSQSWVATQTTGEPNNGGEVRVDPFNQNNVYTILDGTLYKSTNGAAGPFTSLGINTTSFALDPVTQNRIVTSTGEESLDGGTTWTNLGKSGTIVALAEYQGTFAADPGFPTVNDVGANTDDPNTIYISNGTTISVTKNDGANWVTRNLPTVSGTPLGNIADIIVDPRNRDTIYVVRNVLDSAGHKVFVSTNAGQTWTDITGDLPNTPVWTIALDPRNGALYIGTNQGVYTSTNGGANWTVFGNNLPLVQVRDLSLDLSANFLTIATYGRGEYQISINAAQASAGAFRAISGSVIWTGTVQFAGNTVIGVDGSQTLQNGTSSAQLNIVGTISDLTNGGNYTFTKTGGGTLILSGANTYGGVTLINQGVVEVNNPQALGASGPNAGTYVNSVTNPNTALWLVSDLQSEPLFVEGDGVAFNGHNTGVIRNTSGNNTYTGVLTLLGNATIGTESGTSLTIGTKSTLQGTGTITDGTNSYNLTKELTGTLVLGTANTYHGNTTVDQGSLDIQNNNSLGIGGVSSTTTVLDGAQLQMQGGITVASENLRITGTGVGGTGVVESLSGQNTWAGIVTLAKDAGFAPATTPPANVAINVLLSTPTDQLTLGTIGESSVFGEGINKIGGGMLVLPDADTYTGGTNVNQGILKIQNSTSLGSIVNEIQSFTLSGPLTGSFTMSFNGQTTANLSANYSLSNPNFLTNIQTALGALSTIGGISNVNVGWGPGGANTSTFTVTLVGTFAGANQNQITAAGVTGTGMGPFTTVAYSTLQNGTAPTVVASGASLQLDGNPANNGSSLSVTGQEVQLNGTGTPEVQTLTVAGSSGSFTLTFNTKSTTTTLTTPAAVTDIQSALNKILPTGGSASVTALGNSTFMIVFGGTLAGANEPQITVTTSTPTTLTVSSATAQDGGQGALNSISGNNTWAGPVTLVSATSVDVAAGTQLTVSGGGTNKNVRNLTPASVPAPSLTKIGTGTLVFPNADTYTGGTNINQGILNIQNSTSLGSVVNDVQSFTISGPLTGTFTLTFNGKTTPQLSSNYSTTNPTFLSAIQTALGNLSTIGGTSNVTVAWGSGGANTSTFTVTFVGTLAGQDQNLMTATGYSSVAVAATKVQDGSSGTVVANGATLQIQGGITVQNVPLTIAGSGFANNEGAVEVVNGANTWIGNITMTGNSTFGADLSNSSLVVNGVLSDGGKGYTVTKTGPGTLDLAGTTSNTYTGSTSVTNGTLLLDKSGTAAALAGTVLNVGDGIGSAGSAVARWTNSNQAPNTTTLTVLADGKADLNNNTQTISTLNLTDGTVTTGTGSTGALTLTNLNMTGGNLTTGTSGSQVIVSGSGTLSATSDASGTATIGGSGTLQLGSTARTITVTAGTQSTDLLVSALIAGSVGSTTVALTKAGSGTAVFSGANTYTGVTSVTGGSLLVNGPNGKIGNVTVTNATIGGDGTVGTITSTNSKVSPGNAVGVAGTLTGTSATLDNNSNYFVDLNGATNYDQLNLSGSIDLGGAMLTGDSTTGYGPTVGTSFTIITAAGGLLNGDKFAQGSSIYINGRSYTITYNSTSVVLNRVITQSVTTLTSSTTNNTSVFGQGVTFTATVASIAGTGTPPSGNVVFVVDGGTANEVDVTKALSNGVATLTFADLPASLSVGSHTVSVSYATGNDFSGSNASLTQTVNKDNTSWAITPPSVTPVYGQSASYVVTVNPVAPGAGTPSGNVTLYVDGANDGTSALSNGQASFTLTTLSAGQHQFNVSYTGDGSFNSFTNTTYSNYSSTINKAATTTTSVVPDFSPITFGQTATFRATVAVTSPGSGVPLSSDTIDFFDNGVKIGSGTLDTNPSDATYLQASFITAAGALAGGTHPITATFNGDSNFAASSSTSPLSFPVAPSQTITGLTVSPTSPVYTQTVTISAQVTAQSPGAGLGTLDGDVIFSVDGSQQGNPVAINNSGKATISVLTLNPGTHTILAIYQGDTDFATSSASGSVTVTPPNVSETLNVSPSPAVYGNSLSFSTVLSALVPSNNTPSGTVTFSVTDSSGNLINSTTVNVTPIANTYNSTASSTLSSLLTPGTYTITAAYSGDTNFDQHVSTFSETVNKAPTTTTMVSVSPNTASFGSLVTLKASVALASNAPGGIGGPQAGDDIQFLADGTPIQGGSAAIDSSGNAILNTSAIPAGTQTITAEYVGNATLASSTSSTGIGVTVSQGSVTLSSISSSVANSLTYGNPVDFTVTLTPANSPPLQPTGTVTFTDTNSGKVIGTATVANDQATLTTGAGSVPFLDAGSYNIVATYGGDSNYTASSPTAGYSQTITQGQSTLTLSPSTAVNSVYGQSSVVTATVAPKPPAGGVPTGTVTFTATSNGVTTQFGPVTLVNGVATLPATALTPGTYSITASYSGSIDFSSSVSNSLTPVQVTVSKANSQVSVSADSEPSAYGNNVTYTATVASVSPGSGTPTGTVIFTVDGVASAPVALSANGTATYVETAPSAGVHTVSVTYSGDGNFLTSTTATPYQHTVTPPPPPPPPLSQNAQFVTEAYTLLLDRGTDPGGLAYWTGQLNIGVPRYTLLVQIESSHEFHADEVTTAYETYLRRAPDPVSLNSYANLLDAGGTMTQVRADLIGSDEYFVNFGGGTNAGFLNAVYSDVLHRPVDAYGMSFFAPLLQQFTPRTAVASALLSTSEATSDLVQALYTTYLHRSADPSGLAFWTNYLLQGNREEWAIAGFLESSEFFNNLS